MMLSMLVGAKTVAESREILNAAGFRVHRVINKNKYIVSNKHFKSSVYTADLIKFANAIENEKQKDKSNEEAIRDVCCCGVNFSYRLFCFCERDR